MSSPALILDGESLSLEVLRRFELDRPTVTLAFVTPAGERSV
jgi:hypothetical protein